MSSSNEQKRSHPHVPKFGEWSNKGGNVPYTAVFDKARKGKLKDGVKIMNPNDPEENPEFSTMVEKEKMKGEGMARIKLPVVNEKNNRQHFSESESVAASRSLRVGCSGRFSSHHRRRSDESELSFCSEKISFECNNSSVILQQQRRQRLKERSEKKKGLASSSRRASTASSGHHRKQSSISITDADMIPIPKFGEWDENDPKSGEDFTLKFNKVKEENKNVSEMFSTVLSSEPNRGRITHKKSFFISKIKVIAAYMLAVLGGNTSPSADDLKNILASVGAEAGDDRIELMLSQVKGKCITELVACGREKLASVHPSGGAGAVDVAAPPTGDVPPPSEHNEDRVEDDEESDNEIFSIFDDDV